VPAVDVRDLVVRYGTRPAVAGLTFSAAAAQVTALVGPNGAGKTSTVEVCVGLRRANAGTVKVLGEQLRAAGPSSGLRARVGVMLQDGGLYSGARPLELVRHVAALHPRRLEPAALLERLGVDPSTRTTIRRMSGGEQRRVAAAAALVGAPELVFLDEPTAGLDAIARRGFHDLVRELVAGGTTVVLTTHIMDDVERLADHVVIVAGGRVLRDGAVTDLVGDDESITFRGPLHADVNGLQAVLPPGGRVMEVSPGTYRVTGAADPLVLSAIASWCAQHHISTSGLNVGRRSLEDVVIELVGGLE
jgi:ABC-2 type transport system ATP-binding protein